MLLSRCAQWFKDLWDAEIKWMQELPELPSFGVTEGRCVFDLHLASTPYCYNSHSSYNYHKEVFRFIPCNDERLDVLPGSRSGWPQQVQCRLAVHRDSLPRSLHKRKLKTSVIIENIWAENWTQARAWPFHLRSQDMNELQQRQCTGQFHDFQLATFLKQNKKHKSRFDLSFWLRLATLVFFAPNALAEVEHGLDQWKDLAKTYGVDLILTAHRHIQEAGLAGTKSLAKVMKSLAEKLEKS